MDTRLMFRTTTIVIAGWTLFINTVRADDVLRFRGEHGSGRFSEKGLPAEWSDDQNIAWKCELPGPGSSSPIVLDDKIYLTCYSGYGLSEEEPGDPANLKRWIVCVHRPDGTISWKKQVPYSQTPDEPYEGRKTLHGFASGTLASDGERLYAFFGTWGVYAFTMEGDMLWRTEVGKGTHSWGSSNSSVLYGDLVIVNASVESNRMVALEKASGKEVWSAPGMDASWNTPILVDVDGRQELVVSVKGQILGFDPKSGKKLWSCEGIQDYVCPSLVSHDGVVFAIGGRRNTAIAVRVGGKGDVTKSHKLWEARKGSNVSSPVYFDGHLYWASERLGVAYCVDAKTGETKFEERLQPRPGLVYSSIAAADDKLYITSRESGTYVLAAKPEFQLLAHNAFESDSSVFNACPVPHNGQLLLRSDRFLYCIGKGNPGGN